MAKFSPDREPTANERNLLSLLSWRSREAAQFRQEIADLQAKLLIAENREKSRQAVAEWYMHPATLKRKEAIDSPLGGME